MLRNGNPPLLLVLGATGYLGSYLYANVPKEFSKLGTSSKGQDGLFSLNLESPASFNFGMIEQGDTVLMVAAISSPDICAGEHSRAWAVNVKGTSEFVERAISRGANVIFFSSDTIYGEHKEFFYESAAPKPAGEYAEMKACLESMFAGNLSFKSIRLSYVFSKDDKFTQYLTRCAKGGIEAELFHPFYRSIIHRSDVVEAVFSLVKNWEKFPQQVINFCGPEVLSRVEFADLLRREVFLDLRYKVVEPDDNFFKNRPRIISMSSEVLPKLLGRPARRLADAISIEFK